MDKKLLLADRIAERTKTVTIAGVGDVVVRALTRYELMLSTKNTDDSALTERRTLMFAMVDPELTLDEVELWQKRSPAGELTAVTEAIRDLSGLGEGAGKSDVPTDGGQP